MPSMSILVIERGPDNFNDPAVTNPIFFAQNILPLETPSPRMMFYQGQSEPQIAGRAMGVPAGSILGGGSSIHMLTYTRGQREDMDAWRMPGWSASGLLPYMKKVRPFLHLGW
jgi:alcohol oxidase